ncbi:hypothetical protein [Virgibacillus chiguensis]|uniref:Uncharacterized protein n=1 Tax=Virgibacillus chiguensis TaxID=411959 RepID=A0A1M5RH99_9BACI|nr:hypothetical protein [Virgibacillus chiguensis]SHH25163.1 hypothetical protein SAMN05421807_105144 [Virgibacillus chiguensis]
MLKQIGLMYMRLWYYGVVVWLKKHPAPARDENVYKYHQTSQMKVITIVFSMLTILEGGLLHFLLHFWNETIAWITTIIHVHALVYCMALFQSAKHKPHVIEGNKVNIQFGFQSNLELDIRNISEIVAAQPISFETKIPKHTYVSLMQWDDPHYAFILKQPVPLKKIFGKTRSITSVVLRADDMEGMIARIKDFPYNIDEQLLKEDEKVRKHEHKEVSSR